MNATNSPQQMLLGGKVRRLALSSATGIAALAVVAACGGGGSDNSSTDSGGGGSNAPLSVSGSKLVNSDGMTLYMADEEKSGKIVCTGSCLGFWFPLTSSSSDVPTPDGVSGKLGTVKRPDDGKLQVTFNGSPLYTFKLDTSAGDAKGDGFKDDFDGKTFTWHAASNSAAGEAPSAPSTSTDNDDDDGGYGDY